jgi:hypothetical protein
MTGGLEAADQSPFTPSWISVVRFPPTLAFNTLTLMRRFSL